MKETFLCLKYKELTVYLDLKFVIDYGNPFRIIAYAKKYSQF